MISAHDRLSECVDLSRRYGFGRIEVANAAQIAVAMIYFRPQDEALERALAAAGAASRVGHLRAELNARAVAMFALFNLAELSPCLEQAAQAQTLVRRLGAWRFEALCLRIRGRVALAERQRDEAVRTLREAVDVRRRTGVAFDGPRCLSALALAVENRTERLQLLAEGEALIQAGCVGHNPLNFYPDAVEVCLELGEFSEVERHAMALEDYTRPEPLPSADFYIARGRALAAFGQGSCDTGLLATLRYLRD